MTTRLAEENPHLAGGWLLYFNGIETPCVSGRTSFAENRIAECAITVPYSRLFRGLGRGDRIQAALFYYNDYREIAAWELLYDGELVAQDVAKSSDGTKQLTFTAIDHMQIMTQVFPHFVSTTKGIVRANTGLNNASSISTAPFPKTTVFFNTNLADPDDPTKKVRRPFDVAMNVLYTLMGLDKANEDDRSIISKQFFARWEKRVKFTNRWIPSDNYEDIDDDWVFPILRAAQDTSVFDALQKAGDQLAASASYYVFLQYIFQRMYSSICTIPAPPALIARDRTHDILGKHEQGKAVAEGQHIQLGQYLVKPRVFFGIPPKCNVLWGSTIRSLTYSENYILQPTRTYIGNANVLRVSGRNGQGANTSRGLLANLALTSAYPEEADRQLRSKSNATNQDNFLVYPEEFFKGPVYNSGKTPDWFLMLANTQKAGNRDAAFVKIYAKVEHFRARGAQRNGSVEMIFFPYVVPGLPALIPSGSEDGDDLYVEITSVTHTLSDGTTSTSVTFTNAQFVDEMLQGLLADRLKLPEGERQSLDMSPMHPIKALRERFQNMDAAAEYYSRVLYALEETNTVPNQYEMFAIKIGDGPGADIRTLEDPSVLTYELLEEYALRLSPSHEQYDRNTIAAMAYCARPVCTLEDYIDFQGTYGVRQGRVPSNAEAGGKASEYWIKILNLVQGPGPEPGHTSDGERCAVSALDADTAANWESRLLRIREAIYYTEHPQKS